MPANTTPKTRAMIQVDATTHTWIKTLAAKHKVGISILTAIILAEGRKRIRSGELKIQGPSIQSKPNP
jgi:hypothetical protein